VAKPQEPTTLKSENAISLDWCAAHSPVLLDDEMGRLRKAALGETFPVLSSSSDEASAKL
jgi:hypothetical protein